VEISLSRKEAQILHNVVERYLDEVRDVYGRNPAARPLVGEEQDTLERILRELHALSGPPGAVHD
jgi:hypothetical protein